MSHKNRGRLLVVSVFTLIFALFVVIAFFENQSTIESQMESVRDEEKILVQKISTILNYTLGNANGVVSFIKTYPDLNQEEFGHYVSSVINPNSHVISHYVAIKGTTIAFSYPLEGNESGIGIDLLTIEDQKEEILKVKNENVKMLVGPVELVEGGKRLIYRLPVFLNDANQTYWGQVSVIIRYEDLLSEAEINEFANLYNIVIKQINLDGSSRMIFENINAFTEHAIESIVEVPNGQWIITMEAKELLSIRNNLFYVILLSGFIFSLVVSATIRYIMLVNENLNKIVESRTEHIQNVNEKLTHSLEQLKSTQNQLIEKEKHAALGALVAGVAHEIKTPLGVCVTANSLVKKVAHELVDKLDENQLKKSELVEGLNRFKDSSLVIESNLTRTNNLINSFKQLSVDQQFEENRVINVEKYFEYIIHSVQPAYKSGQHTIDLQVESVIMVETLPGALAQILTNLLLNSLTHGFDQLKKGQVIIKVHLLKKELIINYYDNGNGIDSAIVDKIFDPFFTTKRSLGNTGLGMHIIYNLITQKFDGNIELVDNVEKGVHFKLTIPVTLH